MATVIASRAVNFDQLDVTGLAGATLLSPTPTSVSFGDNTVFVTFLGSFQYSGARLVGGFVTTYRETVQGQTGVEITGVNVPVTSILQWAQAGDNLAVRNAFLGGSDTIQGSMQGDFLRGYGGDDSIFGGGGTDTIEGGVGRNYLRGDDGDDRMFGGTDFDDINGNKGNDIATGGAGDDWVVGGQDNDWLFGDVGNDIVYGNLGVDRLEGGDGADLVRGGQGNDSLRGDAGDDWLSGDRGDDVISGGSGADTFHSFNEANHDSIVDFNRSEGDRILLDPGTTYRVEQAGPNVLITMAPGHTIGLMNVSLSSLTGDWIVVMPS